MAGTLNLQEVLQNSTAYIASLSHLDSSAIYLYQDEAYLQLGATTPPLPSDFPVHLRTLPLADHPHVQQAIATRQPVLLADTLAAPLTDAEAEVTQLRGLRTILYLPLVADSKLLGLMIVASTSRAVVLEESEIELCRTMANLAAVAVNNAQLFETVQQTKTKIALQARRAEALLALPVAAEAMSERDFMQFGADLAEQLTESHIAFIHLVYDDQQTIELGSWSHATQQHYCHAAYDNHYPIDEAGIWADALRQRAPVVFNDYESVTHKHGLPEGHAALVRLISVPVIEGGLVRMMVGVGNKAVAYDELDMETVQLVASTVWRIVAKTRATQALKANENKLEAILGGVEAHIYIKGTDYRYQYANRRVCELFDKNLPDIIGREDSELFDAATAERLRGSDKRVIEGGERVAEEEVNSNAIGNVTKAFLTVKIPLRNSDGSIYGLCGISTDITERKRMEDSLLKLSVAVEQSPSSIVITDLDANIVYANATFVQQTGYMLDEIIGQNPRMLHSGKTSRATYDELWAHLMRGEKWQGELINRRKDGSEYIEAVRISPVRDGGGKVVNYLAIKDDITEKKEAEARIQQLAHFDQLTGLPNRTLLQDHFKFALSLAQRSGEHLAIMFLDLDYFKNINDTLGHGIGDLLLMEVAKRLMLAVREEDTVSRLGGDEFIFILPGTDAIGAVHVAKKLIEIISVPYQIEQHELITTPSIGIAIYPEDGTDMETLSKNADAAMYQVKQANRNDFRFFTPAMQANSVRNLRLGSDLRHALAREQLTLVYQPQIAMQDGRTVGAEALLRWQHPELGTISPVEFIPIAEASGLIIQIGEWVLRTAAAQMKAWLDKGAPSMVVAVNLSAVQFRHANLVKMVSDILTETGLPANSLELELTEAVAMDDPQAAVAVMDKLYERGIRMSIDDFGTGYSSLSYLKRFKVYKLKIDQSFVHDISTDSEDKAIVSAIINMASSLGMHTIAEGVETAEQLAFLRLHGCDEVQGYYFSKPLTVDDFEKKMLNGGVLIAQ